MLDRLLAAGGDPCWDPELGLRAVQVTTANRRRTLAKSLERAVCDAHRPPRWTCAVPLDRRAARAAAPALHAVAADLTEATAPDPQGIALVEQLLRDPGSPLYMPGDEDALRECVRIVRQALG